MVTAAHPAPSPSTAPPPRKSSQPPRRSAARIPSSSGDRTGGPAVKLDGGPAGKDPRFKRVLDKLQKSAQKARSHEPAAKKTQQAQAASIPPANEKLAG